MMGVDFDPYSHRWKQDPYPIYRLLRDESPVHYAPGSGSWTISRHADVVRVLTTPEVFSSKQYGGQRQLREKMRKRDAVRMLGRFLWRMRAAPWRMAKSRMLILEDGEVHALMRNIVNRGFTPRRIRAWEGRIRELASDGLARLREHGEFDLMQELAIPLPVTVIAELLGIERERRDDFKRWSDAIIQGGTGSTMGAGSPQLFDAMADLRAYLRPIVRARRAHSRDDLISTLCEAKGAAALDDFEIFMFVLLLLVAGNETTTNLLGNTVDALLEHPEQLERVRSDPSLMPALVEEGLRYDGPIQFLNRRATSDFELRGVTIPKGAQVVVLLGSANRDERRYPDPDRFDVTRDTRGHVAFGLGAHFCLGAALARLEARSALEVLVPELASLTRVRPEREFLDSYQIRGRSRLELARAA